MLTYPITIEEYYQSLMNRPAVLSHSNEFHPRISPYLIMLNLTVTNVHLISSGAECFKDYEGQARLFCTKCQTYGPIKSFTVKKKRWEDTSKAREFVQGVLLGERLVQNQTPAHCPTCQAKLIPYEGRLIENTQEIQVVTFGDLTEEIAKSRKWTKAQQHLFDEKGYAAVGTQIVRYRGMMPFDKATLTFMPATLTIDRLAIQIEDEPTRYRRFQAGSETFTSCNPRSFSNEFVYTTSFPALTLTEFEPGATYANKLGFSTLVDTIYTKTHRAYESPLMSLDPILRYRDDLVGTPALEQLIKGGFEVLVADACISDSLRYPNSSSHVTNTFLSLLDASKTTPAQILGFSKATLKSLLEAGHFKTVEQFTVLMRLNAINTIDVGVLSHQSKAFHLGHLIGMDAVFELLTQYGYTVSELLTYGTKVVTQQGLTPSNVIIFLRDCCSMCDALEVRLDKFPKSLRLEHDVMARNFEYKKDELLEKQFQIVVSRHRFLAYETEDFLIRLPEKPEDLVKEGRELNHCVASYVQRMSKGESIILLLRRTSKPEEPFITIEWRNGDVIQARGYGNRLLEDHPRPVNAFYQSWLEQVKPMQSRPKSA